MFGFTSREVLWLIELNRMPYAIKRISISNENEKTILHFHADGYSTGEIVSIPWLEYSIVGRSSTIQNAFKKSNP